MGKNGGFSVSILMIGNGFSPAAAKLRRSLEQQCFQVDVIEPTFGKLETVRQRYFDLILLDGDSGGSDSLEFYRRLITNDGLGSIPVIILNNDNTLEKSLISPLLTSPFGYLSRDDLLNGKLWPLLEHVHYLINRYG